MINKIDLKRRSGFLGNAKSTTQAPYRQIKRVPEMYSFGENSHFITPENQEEIDKLPKGINR